MENFAPRGNQYPDKDPHDYVRGFTSPLPYVVRNEQGDWNLDYLVFQPQKFKFDTNSCWCISGINCVEDQLDYLLRRGSFPDAHIAWFKANGYLDANNCFRLSWRFIYALSGVYGAGNSQWNFWKLISKYGIIPQNDFDFTLADSQQYLTQDDMCEAAGDKSLITEAMKAKAKNFLRYIAVDYEWTAPIGTTPQITTLQAALKQAPQQIGVPACLDTWNTGNVISCGRNVPDHAVELLKVDDDGLRHIYDQYHPENKTLAKDYPILMVTNGVISPSITYEEIPEVKPFEENFFTRVWESVVEWVSKSYNY